MDFRQLPVELRSLVGIVLFDLPDQTENGTDLLHQRILALRQQSRRLVRQLKQTLRILRKLVFSQNLLVLTGLQIRITDFLQLMPQQIQLFRLQAFALQILQTPPAFVQMRSFIVTTFEQLL